MTLRIWDLNSGACLHTLKGHKGVVLGVRGTSDGHRAVSWSIDNTVRVWNLESGACLLTLEGHSESICSVTMTPDGRRAVSWSWDNTVRVWNLESGVCIAVCILTCRSDADALESLVLSDHGNTICVGTNKGEVLFFGVYGIEPGPSLQPDTRDESYERLLRHGLDLSRDEKGDAHEETLAHLRALFFHLETMGKPAEWQLLARDYLEAVSQRAAEARRNPLAVRRAANDLYRRGEYARATEKLNALIEVGFELPGTHCHLARIALLSEDLPAVRQHLDEAWSHHAASTAYVAPRMLWLLSALWSLERLNSGEEAKLPSSLLGRLKTALQVEGAHMEWTMDPVLAHLKSKLPAEAHALLTALVAALNSPDNVGALDEFPAWREAVPQPLD
jgi:hypothetical protein